MRCPHLCASKGAPTIPGSGLPRHGRSSLFGLFGNDDAKYGQDGVSHIETNQIFAKKETLQFKRDQRLHGETLTGFVAQTGRRGLPTRPSLLFFRALTMRMICYYIDSSSHA